MQVDNPFQLIVERLTKIEQCLTVLKSNCENENRAYLHLWDKPILVPELAELLGLSIPTVYSKICKGQIPGISKRGKRIYADRQVVIDWIKTGRREPQCDATVYLKKKGGHHV